MKWSTGASEVTQACLQLGIRDAGSLQFGVGVGQESACVARAIRRRRLASRQGLGQFGGPLLAGRRKRDADSLTFISVLLTAPAPRAAARFARSGYRRGGVKRAAHH
jgi:hypothetical protein